MRAPGSHWRSSGNHSRGRGRMNATRFAAVTLGLGLCCSATAADVEDAQKLFQTGRYEECARRHRGSR